MDKLIAKAKDKLEGNVSEGHEPVIIYMRQEIIGTDAISSTSFKKLGLFLFRQDTRQVRIL